MRNALLILLAFTVTPVFAGGDWVHVSGTLRFGVTDRVPDATAYAFGDATLRFTTPGSRFGAELGVYGYANGADSPHETYGTLTWQTGDIRIAAGVPRAAYDSFAASAFDTTFVTFGADQAPVTRATATWGPMFQGHLPFGLRVDTQGEAFRFAASVHHAENVGVTSASAGLSYTVGAFSLAAALEGSFGATDTVSGKLQALWSDGPLEAGLGLYAPGAAGADEMAEVFATYSATDEFSITGIFQTPISGGDVSAGVLGRYTVRQGLDISIGALNPAGNDPVYNASIGLNF